MAASFVLYGYLYLLVKIQITELLTKELDSSVYIMSGSPSIHT